MTDTPIYIALGANLPSMAGPPEFTLEAALAALDSGGIAVREMSRFYRTAPVPASDQPDFVNAAARLETALGPEVLLARLHGVERQFGRQRKEKWEARVLDLDLIAYGSRVLPKDWPGGTPGKPPVAPPLIVPHPRLHSRPFVLVPLAEIAPGWMHPVRRQTPQEMLARLGHFAAPQPLDFPARRP